MLIFLFFCEWNTDLGYFQGESIMYLQQFNKGKIRFIHHIRLAQSQILQKTLISVYNHTLLLSSGPFFRGFATQTWGAFYNIQELHDLWKKESNDVYTANKWRWRNDPVKAKRRARYTQENVWPIQSAWKPITRWAAVHWGFFQRITWNIAFEFSHKDRTVWELTSKNGHTNW